jgi:hypothetical protein
MTNDVVVARLSSAGGSLMEAGSCREGEETEDRGGGGVPCGRCHAEEGRGAGPDRCAAGAGRRIAWRHGAPEKRESKGLTCAPHGHSARFNSFK